MNGREDGGVAVGAALFVLMAAMLSPVVSAGLAALFLVGLGARALLQGRR
ncbi:MAG: hypothetical protein ACYC1C_19685 [Chloroflexota bacterium]